MMGLLVCPNCGAEIKDEYKVCPNCGYDFLNKKTGADSHTGNPNTEIPPVPSIPMVQKKESSYDIKSIVFCVVAFVVFIMSLIAANSISDAGNQISQIKSVGGQTLEEAYYNQLGNLYSGYAMFVRTCGIFFTGILVHIGLKKQGN